jgi:hypothetical protein
MDNVVKTINRDVGDLLKLEPELLRWETHCAPVAGRPQEVVFDNLGDYKVPNAGAAGDIRQAFLD